MQLTFSCPSCGKDYDLPWSMAGKRGRCKRCSNEFKVPAPYEPKPPKSSEAIPVTNPDEPPRSAEAIPVHKAPEPPRSAEAIPVHKAPEPPRTATVPPTLRIETLTPGVLAGLRQAAPPEPVAPPPRVRSRRHASGSDRAAFEPAPVVPARSARRPRPPTPEIPPAPDESPIDASPPISALWSGTRPAWLIPSIAGGGLALILLMNIAFYVAIFGRGGSAPVEPADSKPAEVASRVDPTRETPPVAPPPAAEVAPPPSVSPGKPAPPPRPLGEAGPDGVMSTREIVEKYEASVALIRGKKGSGTGFVARPGIVATNSHVIEGERLKDVEVRFPSAPDGRQGPHPVRLLYQDKDRDLALLAVATDLAPVRLAEGYKFSKGDDVTVIGSPGVGGKMVLENAISRGIVSTMAKINEHSFLQLSIAINPGNSGGPVFDPRGRVIGVVTLKTVNQEGLAFAVPAEDLLSALDTAATAGGGGPATVRSSAPALAYAFQAGRTYVYSVELSADTGNGVVSFSGNSTYRVKSVDPEGITLAHKGSLAITRRDKSGKVVPGGAGGPAQAKEVEVKIDDKGIVVNAWGSSPLPLLLGDFAMLMIEPLPDDPTNSWDDSQMMTLREVEQVPGSGGIGPNLGRPGVDNLPRSGQSRIGGRSRPGSRPGTRQPAPQPPSPQPPKPQVKVTLSEAKEETNYTLGAQVGDRAPIRKSYELATRDMVGNEPRVRLSGDGTISFDLKAGLPISMEARYQLVEIVGNIRVRIPITVSCRLVEGRERERDRESASRVPVNPPAGRSRVDDDELSRFLGDLKSPDNARRREALRAIRDAATIEVRRAEVARALDRSAADPDTSIRGDAIRAMGVWGDDKSLDNLIATLRDPNFGVRDELFEAIGRLSPTEKTAEAIIPWLATEPGRAAKALRAIGPPAEPPLLRAVEDGADPKARQEACRVLKDVGTWQSLSALQSLARRAGDDQIARDAGDAIKAIMGRQ